MSSQLVDINGDGYKDILAGSFSGVPQIIMGAKNGYIKPDNMLDSAGKTILIADFWNDEEDKWDKTDRARSEGHCTSSAAVDWDGDGDLDLLLGDYDGGRIYLRLNEGSAKEPKFVGTNEEVLAGGQPLAVPGGLSAPCVVDWNGDGLFDILCGGAEGGVYYYENVGKKTAPKFAASETLVAPVDDPTGSYIKRVPSKNGEPTAPGSSFHIEAVDYDGDGDLDLLVGGRSSWVPDAKGDLSDEDKQRRKDTSKELKRIRDKINELAQAAEDDEARQKLTEGEEFQKLIQEYQKLSSVLGKLSPEKPQSGDFVWLYRRLN